MGFTPAAVFAKGLTWERPVEIVADQWTDALQVMVEAGLAEIVRKYAPLIEQWMKDNAPWTDRTGDARRGLKAEVEMIVGDSYSIVLDHSVHYGKWLELRWHGRYAIIQPALDHFAPTIFEEVRRFLHGA